MKKKIIIIIVLIILIALAIIGLVLGYKYKQGPSDEEIKQGIIEKDKIRNSLQNVINGVENPDENYQISISEAREKAIIIFNSLGEKDLNKDNVRVVEVNRDGKKYYLIRSLKNSAEVEISTGRVTRINGSVQQ